MNDEMEDYYKEQEQIKAEERGLAHGGIKTESRQSKKVRKPTAEEKQRFLEIFRDNLKKMPGISVDSLISFSRVELSLDDSELILIPTKYWKELV